MWQQIAMTALVITALFAMWAAVQGLKRKTDPRFERGDDVLAGCGTCAVADTCHAYGREDSSACEVHARVAAGGAAPERGTTSAKSRLARARGAAGRQDPRGHRSGCHERASRHGRAVGMSFADVLDVLVTEFLDRRSPKARHERREAKKEKQVHTPNVGSKDKKVRTSNVGSRSRHIPAAVRDEVHVRDGGQCAFKATSGKRCESRKGLEIDHIVPVSAGGTNELSNLRLLCPAHNLREGERTLGERIMAPFWQQE